MISEDDCQGRTVAWSATRPAGTASLTCGTVADVLPGSNRLALGAALLFFVLLASCGERDMSGQSGPQSGVRIEFEDVLVPEAFSRDGTAVRAGDGEAGGLWGVVEGLARPEEAIVRRRGSRRSVSVALFRAGGGLGGHVIRLSPEAADELGLADEPVEVSVVAVRREPRIVGR